MKKLCRHQEDHMDEVEIINLHKRCNRAGAKVETKRAAKAGSKTGAKTPRSEYHLFLREQLEKMTGEDRRNYRNIVSRRWREIKEDLARLSAYNDRVRQMKNEAGGDLLVGSMERQTVTENPVVTKPTKTAPKSAKVPSVC